MARPKLSANAKAALLYLLPALTIFGVWYITLFANNPPGVTPAGAFRFFLNEGPSPVWFRWFLIFPLLCLALSGAYASRLPRTRIGSSVLFAAAVSLAVGAWLTMTFAVALTASLPVFYGYVSVMQHRKGT
jgi:hypothetical protein